MLKRFTLRYQAKFLGDRSNCREDMLIIPFSNMAAFRHLGFVMRVFGTPTKSMVFITVQNLVRIDAVVSITCMFLISRFWLENAYSDPQN